MLSLTEAQRIQSYLYLTDVYKTLNEILTFSPYQVFVDSFKEIQSITLKRHYHILQLYFTNYRKVCYATSKRKLLLLRQFLISFLENQFRMFSLLRSLSAIQYLSTEHFSTSP